MKKEKEYFGAIFVDQKYEDDGFGVGVRWEGKNKNGRLVFKAGQMVKHFKLSRKEVSFIKLFLGEIQGGGN